MTNGRSSAASSVAVWAENRGNRPDPQLIGGQGFGKWLRRGDSMHQHVTGQLRGSIPHPLGGSATFRLECASTHPSDGSRQVSTHYPGGTVRSRFQFAGWLVLAASVAPALPAQQRAINLTGRPVATLDEGLSLVVGLQEVAPGKVVISDPQEQRLLFADFASGQVRDVATKGGGPGEWQIAMDVTPGPNGTAYVADPSLRKMHVIDATGKIVRTVPFPASDNSGNRISITLPRGTDAQGRLYLTGSPFTPGAQEQPDSIAILRWDPRTSRTDTLGMMKNEIRVTQSGGSGNTRAMARIGGGPYSPVTIWTPLLDGRVAVVHPNPYRVDIIEARGRVHTGTAVPYTPVRIGKAERDAYREAMASAPRMTMGIGPGSSAMRMSTGGSGGPQMPEIPDTDFPATMPPFAPSGMTNGINVAPNGEVWVLRSRPASDKVPTYDIWSNGQLVGKATLKPNSLVVGFGQGAVYVARQDPEDDLRYVEKYAL